MPIPECRPLLITNRPHFADHVTSYAPEVDLTVTAPSEMSADAWSTTPMIFIDMDAAAVLCSRGLPPAVHAMVTVITERVPVGQDWHNAVTLQAHRVAWLPKAGPWLTTALRAAVHRPPVIAVIGAGPDSTDTATTVALAVAIDHLARDAQVALVALRDHTTVTQQLSTKRSYAEFASNRTGRLSLITHNGTLFQAGQLRAKLADLGSSQDVIIVDTPLAPSPQATEALTHADLVLAVATPDQLTDPALAALTHPASDVTIQVRLVILTADRDRADPTVLDRAATAHIITPPGPDPTTWLADPDFRRDCSEAAGMMTSSTPAHRHS